MKKYSPTRLPKNERRRASQQTRLAFLAAEQALSDLQLDVSQVSSVFGSASGDTRIIDNICRILASEERPQLSPTQFHNSVHNAAGGYWSIATEARVPTTSLSAYEDTVPAALLEACMLLETDCDQVLLVLSDLVPTGPLRESRPIRFDMAVALLLQRSRNHSIGHLRVIPKGDAQGDFLDECPECLADLCAGNPVGRIIPLLARMVRGVSGSFLLGTTQPVVFELSV